MVDKYRISGFWDTPLDSILSNLGTRTILFAGVNTDQCVFCTLTDANFLGYGCIMVEDCCATTSPDFCTQATVWNVKKCYGFVTQSKDVISALAASRHMSRGREHGARRHAADPSDPSPRRPYGARWASTSATGPSIIRRERAFFPRKPTCRPLSTISKRKRSSCAPGFASAASSRSPNVGDYMAITLLDEPLLIVRGKDGKIHAMSALCRHRGHTLAEKCSGNAKKLRLSLSSLDLRHRRRISSARRA